MCVSVAGSTQGHYRCSSASSLDHGVPLLPPRGWAVLMLLPLPEAGSLSVCLCLSIFLSVHPLFCFFISAALSLSLSLCQVVGFSLTQVAIFIAVLCITSVLAQTFGLTLLMSAFGNKYTIIIGLILQAIQLVIYGVWTTPW